MSKTFQIKWFYGCSCQIPPTAPISDMTYTQKRAERQLLLAQLSQLLCTGFVTQLTGFMREEKILSLRSKEGRKASMSE